MFTVVTIETMHRHLFLLSAYSHSFTYAADHRDFVLCLEHRDPSINKDYE